MEKFERRVRQIARFLIYCGIEFVLDSESRTDIE